MEEIFVIELLRKSHYDMSYNYPVFTYAKMAISDKLSKK